MEPVSRRRALELGLLGAAGLALGACGHRPEPADPRPRSWGTAGTRSPAFTEAPVLRSAGGVLRVELVAAERVVEVAGGPARVLTYGDRVPGATWWLRPGDRVEVQLVNHLDAATNLHVHGLQVSPSGTGDDPFRHVRPGESAGYTFRLDQGHPTGTFWYHPHLHGLVADQVFGGLYGAIVVADDVPVTRDRVLVVSDISLRPDGTVRRATRAERLAGREGELVLVNGLLHPRLRARPGEVERWRVVNACTSRYLDLDLLGPGGDRQPLEVLAIDAHRTQAAPERLVLAPGNRADLLVAADATTSLRTHGYDRGSPMPGMARSGPSGAQGAMTLATLDVGGRPGAVPGPPGPAPAPADLRTRTPDRVREITMTMGMTMGRMMGAGGTLGFDGQAFDPARTDQRVRSGAVEEWTIRNPTPMDHPFHLHVWPMQVLDVSGDRPAAATWRDVVDVPAGGQVTVRIAFGALTGRTVYHCHILDHEDAGMMGVVEVG